MRLLKSKSENCIKNNKCKIFFAEYQGRQTWQNSGGVAYLTKGGLQIFKNFYAIKI